MYLIVIMQKQKKNLKWKKNCEKKKTCLSHLEMQNLELIRAVSHHSPVVPRLVHRQTPRLRELLSAITFLR